MMDDNVSYIFDDEGNPVPVENSAPSSRKPPAAPRSSRSKKRKSSKPSNAESNGMMMTNELETAETRRKGASPEDAAAPENEAPGKGLMTDMFHIDGTGFDVTISDTIGKIYWESMNPNGRRRKRSGSLSGLFRRRKSSSGLKEQQNSIDISQVYGARIRRRRKAGQNENEGFVLGLGLFTIERKDANTLREKEIYFEHPSVEICTRWSDKLNECLESIPGRPKNVKLFLQPYAGDKNGKSIYKHKVLPLFQNAGVAVDCTVIRHNENVKQDMIHLNIDDFDCVIAMGGDGTVNQVLNGLMNRAQREQGVERKAGFTPAKSMVPMGVIPTGKSNHVAYSVMGAVDPVTASLHIIFGNWTPVDVCSVYTPDNFYRWAFNCQYGFGGNVLTFMKRYSSLGLKRIDAAFIKALTSSKLRSYECDIEYIPSPKPYDPKGHDVCRTGCQTCVAQQLTKKSEQEVVTDMVHELDLNNSISSQDSAGSFIELKQDSPWKVLKGDFMNIGIYSIPGNCEIAPQGLSKFTHLHDGNLDLVTVRNTERKEFVRHLRRHGNNKNQFDFPFVQVIRCKELRFRPRMPTSWNYNDHDFSEIKYQMNQQQRLKKQIRKHQSMEMIIDDLDSSQSRPQSVGLQGKAKSMYDLDESDDDDDDDDLEEEGKEAEDTDEKEPKLKEGFMEEKAAVGREGSEPPKYHYVGPQYQPTWNEQEVARRRRMARKKEEKKKMREERKSRSVWNVDNEISQNLELDFRVHNGLLMVCGLGISPHTEFHEIRFGCLPG